jgi:hypothetical protein
MEGMFPALLMMKNEEESLNFEGEHWGRIQRLVRGITLLGSHVYNNMTPTKERTWMINLPRSKEIPSTIYHQDGKHRSSRKRYRKMGTKSAVKMNCGKTGGSAGGGAIWLA